MSHTIDSREWLRHKSDKGAARDIASLAVEALRALDAVDAARHRVASFTEVVGVEIEAVVAAATVSGVLAGDAARDDIAVVAVAGALVEAPDAGQTLVVVAGLAPGVLLMAQLAGRPSRQEVLVLAGEAGGDVADGAPLGALKAVPAAVVEASNAVVAGAS